jgi:hypothetical protein
VRLLGKLAILGAVTLHKEAALPTRRYVGTFAPALVWIGALALQACGHYQKPPFYAHSVAGEIATGLLIPEEGYDLQAAQRRQGMDIKKCLSRSNPDGMLQPYWSCLTIHNDSERCDQEPDPFCVSVTASYYLESEPKKFEALIDSLLHPCKYLPAPEHFTPNQNTDQNIRIWFSSLRRKALCDEFSEKYPGIIILRLMKQGKAIKSFQLR